MIPCRPLLAAVLGLLAGAVAAVPPAAARSEALLIAAAGDQPASAALSETQTALLGWHHFDKATVTTATSPAEMAHLVRGFLAAAGRPEDLRLLWIVGTERGQPGSLCPRLDEPAVAPAVPTVILAPACAKWLVRLPTEPLHVETAIAAFAAAEAVSVSPGPPLAVLGVSAERGSVAVLAGLLKDGGQAPLSPLRMFARLSCALHGGPARAPTLDAAPAAAAWQVNLFGGAPRSLEPPTMESLACSPPVAAASPPAVTTPAPDDARPALAKVPVTNAALPPAAAGAPPPAAETLPPFRAPLTGRIVTGFGRASQGIDIAAPRGTPIRAAAAGEVVFTGAMGARGSVLALKHADGWSSIYAHADTVLVSVGARVTAGQEVARVGASGQAAEPLLHFELRRDGKAMDPTPVFGGKG